MTTGPSLATVTTSTTQTKIIFSSPGTYYINILQRATSLTSTAAIGPAGAAVVSSNTNVASAVAYSGTAILVVNTFGGGIQYDGVAFGNFTITVSRAKRSNRVDLL